MNDVENSAQGIDGQMDIESQGIDESNNEAEKAKKKLEAARDKGGGERGSREGSGGAMGKVTEFFSGRDR